MKKLIIICVATAMTSAAYALPSDDFNDNSMNTSLWNLYQESPNVWLDETNERLEIRSTADANGEVADYYANGWGFSTANNFSFRAYFHCNWPSEPGYSDFINILLGLVKSRVVPVTVRNNSVAIVAGYYVDEYGIEPYFHCGKFTNDGTYVVEGQKTRSQDNGILYISYDASKDELYLSDIGYWAANAWVTIPGLLKGEWGSAVVIPGLGSGYVYNAALDSGEAYLDNFVVDSGTVVPNPADVLLSDNFNDNSINTSMWNLYQESSNVWLDETNQRLEMHSTILAADAGALYFAHDWGFLTTDNFSFKTDFHNSYISDINIPAWTQVMLGLAKGSDPAAGRSNSARIEVAWDTGNTGGSSHPSVFHYAYCIDGNESDFDIPRDSIDGTVYFSYDAGADELYLSHTGYWKTNSWDTITGLLKGRWGGDVVSPFLGGSADWGAALDSGDACLDNFVVDSGTIVPLLFGIYVDDNASGDPGPGNPNISDPLEDGSQEHPFDSIQEAIDTAVDGNTVVVLDGTYTGTGNRDIDFWGMAITVCSRNGPENCIVDCQGGEQLCRGFIFQNGEGADSILDGFTIINGYETYENVGGGILCYSSSPTINNCIIRNNMGDMGGGIYCENNSNPTISNCTISNNIASWGTGGGIYCGWNSSPTIIDCNINNNSSDGIWIDSYAFVEGTTSFASNNLTGNGTLMIEPNAILDVSDCNLSCSIVGIGTILVPAGREFVIENEAVVDLSGDGTLQCNGLLRVKDYGNLLYTNLNVARASFENNAVVAYNTITTSVLAPYGQLLVKDTASITGNDIYAAGDRYLDLNPSTFAGTIQGNSISVTITEGTGNISAGLFELRGYDVNCPSPPCPPGIFSLPEVPEFGLSTWTIDRMELVEGAKVTLTNRVDFQYPYDEGSEYEVLYVKQLILGPNSVLDTAFNRLYYETLEKDSTAEVKNTSLLGFSLGKIDFDEEEFATCIVHNNFIDLNPAPPNTTRIQVERVESLQPDPTGMMWLRNLRDIDPNSPTYGDIINTRAKALFAKCTEEKILIRFKYLFNTAEPGTELVVYLSDVPELLPHNDPQRNYHYIEVARIPAPPPGRPGSPGSGRFGVFQKTVSTEDLNFREGTRIEVELVEPQQGVLRSFSAIDTGLESAPPPGASVFLDSWSAEVHCAGICLDLTGDNYVDEIDFLTVICACGCASELLPGGTGDYVCFEGPFGHDGYIDSYDTSGWDWTLNSGNRKNLCDAVPLSEGMESASLEAGDLNASGIALFANPPGDFNDLLIAGKTSDVSTKLKDRLYVFDSSFKYVRSLSFASERCNIRIVQDPNGQLYEINLEAGVRQLDDQSHKIIIPRNQVTFANEPRYNKSATVYVGIKGEGSYAVGRPILDAAFDTNGYVYVAPVVVNPDGNEPYAAAAKLQLLSSGTPPYKVVKIYDDPPPPGDNQYRNNLRETEIDSAGNIYVLNAHSLNESDILFRYKPNGTIERLELAKPDVNLPDPIGMYMSNATDMLYLASAQYNPEDSNSSIVYGISTKGNLTLTRSITITNMHHATSITEDPATGSLWVVGFNMDIPEYPDPTKPPFYYPRLAKVPLGSNNVQAQSPSGSYDLAMPLSVVWTKTVNCGGADLNKSNRVNFDDFAILRSRWRNSNCTPPTWCDGADLNNSKTVELMDVAVLARHWLETGCLD